MHDAQAAAAGGSESRGRADPEKTGRGCGRVFNKVIMVRRVIKTLSLFHRILAVIQMQADPALEYIAEFLPFMGLMLKELLPGFQVHQQGLHLVLLGGRHDPLDTVAGFIDLLEITFVGENDLFRLRFLKKGGGSGPQAFNQVQQGHHGRPRG